MKAIGIIRTPFADLKNMPIQPKGAVDVIGEIEIEEQYAAGLTDLEGFSHIYLVYLFHKASRVELKVVPFMDTVQRGVFATRSPLRPNHIGLSLVELVKIDGAKLTIRGADILDGTPLIDIKPYIEKFDKVDKSSSGWMTARSRDVGSQTI